MQRVLGEATGTFFLVLLGCGAVMLGFGPWANLVFGATVALMVAALLPVGAGHLNPAVTVALAILRAFPWRLVPSMVAAQSLGAAAAAGLLWSLAPDSSLGAALPRVAVLPALAIEAALTFFLVWVIAAAIDPRSRIHPAGFIGAAILIGGLVGGPWTGAGMNPARAVAPGLVVGQPDLWVYVVGPMVGALAAATSYGLLRPNAMRQAVGGEPA